jgi:uncharacterized membrane protein YfcA
LNDIVTIFNSWPQFGAACLILVIAEGIYVLFGFGAGLIAVGTLAVLMPEIQDVIVLLLLINLPLELWVVLKARRSITWRGVAAICAGIAVGVPLGTRILQHSEPTAILFMLGAVLVAAGLMFLSLPRGGRVRWPSWVAPPVGLISGILAGLFGTGGPPLILYYQCRGIAKTVFRGNLMAIFLLVTFVRVPTYALSGLITAPRLWSALAVMPAVGLGAWLGNRIHLNVSEASFRRLVSLALVGIGAVLLARRIL